MEKNEFRKALKIGSVSIFTYLVSYVSRKILSVTTPFITAEGLFTKEYLGMLSSIYLAMYAAGQLVNGILGDRVRSRYMVAIGCLISGAGVALFPLVNSVPIHYLCFAMQGFGLSMLRGPLMKVIAENTLPSAARKICTLFSVAGFAGPLVATGLSVVCPWRAVFFVTAAFSWGMGLLAYILLSVMERGGEITFSRKKQSFFQSVGALFRVPGFAFYMLVAAIVEIVSSSVMFWIPTYLREYLMLSEETSAVTFSIISVITVFCPFIGVYLYEHVIKDGVREVGLCMTLAVICYGALAFTGTMPILNVALCCLGKIGVACASSTLWSIYIPALAKYGCVSSGNGIFDFFGYAMASIAGVFFAGAVDAIGWKGLIFVWAGIMALGVVGSLFTLLLRRTKKAAENG